MLNVAKNLIWNNQEDFNWKFSEKNWHKFIGIIIAKLLDNRKKTNQKFNFFCGLTDKLPPMSQ